MKLTKEQRPAPERIFMHGRPIDDGLWQWGVGRDAVIVPYARADLLAQAERERDQLRATLTEIYEWADSVADGAPDADEASKRGNWITGLCERVGIPAKEGAAL